jgi:uncharacterized membrane protein (UPF0127 family)
MTRIALLAAVALLTACTPSNSHDTAQASANAAQPSDALLPLAIHSADATRRFEVEVAMTPAEQAQGLMFRKALDPDAGMLFPMDPPRTASFWMKNTLIPLDMLFIRTDGTIAFIGANAQPYSQEPVSAGIPVAAVLELAGGRAAALGIKEGDRVNWGRCSMPEGQVQDSTQSAWRSLNFCPKP